MQQTTTERPAMNTLTFNSSTLDLSALDRANLAKGTRRHYRAAVARMILSGINPFDPANYDELAQYAASLPSSGQSNLKAALRIISKDYVNRAKISNGSVESIQRFLWLIEVMNDTINVKQPPTERTPHWLSQEQVDRLLSAARPNQRDYIVLAVLVGSALRREELSNLSFSHLSQIPENGTMLDVLAVVHGKGDKKRFIPITKELAYELRDWEAYTGGGKIARSINKAGKLGESLSTNAIFDIVRKYGSMIGINDLDPHDLRRTYGRLLYESTKDILLVMIRLGHKDVKTTQIYIGLHIK
jgi:integrase